MNPRIFLPLWLFSLSNLSLYGQKFSDNTELHLLNQYAHEFNIRLLKEYEYKNMLNNVVQYVQHFKLTKDMTRSACIIASETHDKVYLSHPLNPNFAKYDSFPELRKLREEFHYSCKGAIYELKNINYTYPNDKWRLKQKMKLITFLHLPSSFSILQIENYVRRLRSTDSLQRAHELLADYYQTPSGVGYDFNSLEKVIYYLNALLSLYEGNEAKQHTILSRLHLTVWWTSDNFFSYERLIPIYLQVYEIEKKISHSNVATDNILNTLVIMYRQQRKAVVLNKHDAQLMEHLCLILFNKAINSHRPKEESFFSTIGLFLEEVRQNRQTYTLGKEIEKSYLISGCLAFTHRNYSNFRTALWNYLITFSSINTQRVPLYAYMNLFNDVWDGWVQLEGVLNRNDTSRNLYAQFGKHYYLNVFLRNLKSYTCSDINQANNYVNLLWDSARFGAINTMHLISERVLPFDISNVGLQKWVIGAFAEIVSEEEGKYLLDYTLGFPTDSSLRTLMSLYKSKTAPIAYLLLKNKDSITEFSGLWRYRALLKGELQALKDESNRKSGELYLIEQRSQKERAEREIKGKSDSLKISDNNYRVSQIQLGISKNNLNATKKWLMTSIYSFLFVVVLFLVIASINKRKRFELELMINSTSINTHFVKNLLGGPLQESILSKNIDRIDYVSTAINTFIKTHHNINNYQNKLILIKEEIHYLMLYIELQHFRFKDKLKEKPEIRNENLNEDDLYDYRIPTMFIQPFIENAFEHGLENGGTTVRITFSKRYKDLCVTVRNDGKLFNQHELVFYNSPSAIRKSKENNAIINTLRRVILNNGTIFERLSYDLMGIIHKYLLQKRKNQKSTQILWSIKNVEKEMSEVRLIFKNLIRYD